MNGAQVRSQAIDIQMEIIQGLVMGESACDILKLVLKGVTLRFGEDCVGCIWNIGSDSSAPVGSLCASSNLTPEETTLLQNQVCRFEPVPADADVSANILASFRHVLEKLGLKSVHLHPIRNIQSAVVGVAALGFRDEREIADFDMNVFKHYIRVGGLAIERERLERENHFLAYYDYLTKIPNRRSFHQTLDKLLGEAQARNTSVALALLDLDNFKEINDTFGHSTGDRVLENVAHRLQHSVRTDDTVARLGGDEFGIILPQASGRMGVQVLEAVVKALQEPLHVDGGTFCLRASVGVSTCPANGTKDDELLKMADKALYLAKSSPDLSVALYEASDR